MPENGPSPPPGSCRLAPPPTRPPLPLWPGLLLVLIAATATALSGNGSTLPLDEHDIFVARSAEEMMQRNSYLVPYLNGEPRLKKPPLQNWLALGGHWARGRRDTTISPFEARLPSAAAGVALALLTYLLGCLLLDAPTALVAALLIVSSKDFVNYTHAARPEMLYAAVCTAGILAFALADHWLDDSDASGTSDSLGIEGTATIARTTGTTCTPGPLSATSAIRSRRAGTQSAIPPSFKSQIPNPKSQVLSARARWASWGGWFFMGLAMLTKGPQLPAIILVGLAVYLVATGRRAVLWRVLRPASGLVIFSVVSLWWYALVLRSVPDAWTIWQGEMERRGGAGGHLWLRWFEPYYLYHTAVMIVPWVVLYPLALAAPWLTGLRRHKGVILLWWLTVVGMVVLNLAGPGGRRWYYMLPLMGPLALLMAAGGMAAWRWLAARKAGNWWTIIVAVHAVGLGAALWVMQHVHNLYSRPPAAAAILVSLVGVVAVVWVVMSMRGQEPAPANALAGVALVGVAFLAGASARYSLMSKDRFDRWTFARAVAATARVGPVTAWGQAWPFEEYAGKRQVTVVHNANELRDAIGPAPTAWLLVREADKPQLPPATAADLCLTEDLGGKGHPEENLRLLRLRPMSAATSRPGEDRVR